VYSERTRDVGHGLNKYISTGHREVTFHNENVEAQGGAQGSSGMPVLGDIHAYIEKVMSSLVQL